MADIELIVKIPEEKYKWVKENNPKADKNSFIGIIVHGTPLPKGHGRLIDADRFINDFACCGYIEDMDVDYFRTVVPTVIEADKESEE